MCSCFVVVCPSQPSADKVKEVTAFSREYLEKIERARIEMDYQQVHNSASSCHSSPALSLCLTFVCPAALHILSVLFQVVKLCRECLEKQENILADTHLYKLSVLSVASEVLSYLKLFSEAAPHAHKMVEGYT